MFCPSCGKEVSDQAKTCPGCGHPFQSDTSPKSKTTALVLCLVLMGFHRFYVGKIWSAILFILSGGGCLIWWLIDLVNISRGVFEDSEGRKLVK